MSGKWNQIGLEYHKCDYCGSKIMGDRGGETVHRAVLDYSYRKNYPSLRIKKIVDRDTSAGRHVHFLVCESCYLELHRNIGLDSMQWIGRRGVTDYNFKGEEEEAK